MIYADSLTRLARFAQSAEQVQPQIVAYAISPDHGKYTNHYDDGCRLLYPEGRNPPVLLVQPSGQTSMLRPQEGMDPWNLPGPYSLDPNDPTNAYVMASIVDPTGPVTETVMTPEEEAEWVALWGADINDPDVHRVLE